MGLVAGPGRYFKNCPGADAIGRRSTRTTWQALEGDRGMAGRTVGYDLLSQLSILSQVGVVGGLSDGELLQRFLTGCDGASEAAFTALVQRHGPMVLRVCRQVLGDADGRRGRLPGHVPDPRPQGRVDPQGRFRGELAPRGRPEGRGAGQDGCQPPAGPTSGGRRRSGRRNDRGRARPDEWAELHEEIARLPGRYREPVVLCYFEGLTSEAAADRLGCPQGTILSRLSRARTRLAAATDPPRPDAAGGIARRALPAGARGRGPADGAPRYDGAGVSGVRGDAGDRRCVPVRPRWWLSQEKDSAP